MAQESIVCFSPTQQHIAEIEEWLIAEREKTGEGFYCNWSIIKSMFEKNQVATISDGKLIVGFVTWCITSDFTARIDIAEIKPGCRKKDFGRKMIEELFVFLKNKGILVVDLQCAPASSERVWKRLGFSEFPDPPESYMFNSGEDKRLYYILTEKLATSEAIFAGETIELWNDEPYLTGDNSPTYTWIVSFKPGTKELLIPIIHPAHYDWRLRWCSNGKVIRDDKVKYFGSEIDFNTFIVIKELNLN